ncbi:MAG: hypothetical protein M1296_03155 [Chloroflexi bacterium]|nr:hypothetical protein [Chloroflexota bacterium]
MVSRGEGPALRNTTVEGFNFGGKCCGYEVRLFRGVAIVDFSAIEPLSGQGLVAWSLDGSHRWRASLHYKTPFLSGYYGTRMSNQSPLPQA